MAFSLALALTPNAEATNTCCPQSWIGDTGFDWHTTNDGWCNSDDHFAANQSTYEVVGVSHGGGLVSYNRTTVRLQYCGSDDIGVYPCETEDESLYRVNLLSHTCHASCAGNPGYQTDPSAASCDRIVAIFCWPGGADDSTGSPAGVDGFDTRSENTNIRIDIVHHSGTPYTADYDLIRENIWDTFAAGSTYGTNTVRTGDSYYLHNGIDCECANPNLNSCK